MPTVVRDIMSRSPATVAEQASIDDALATLLDASVAEVYVCAGGNLLLGVIPDYELLKSQCLPAATDKNARSLMSPNLATVSPEARIAEIAPLFRSASCARVAVVDEGRLVGQIARLDVLRVIAAQRSAESAVAMTQASPPVTSDAPAPRFLQSRMAATTRVVD